MSGARIIDVEIAVDPDYSVWQIQIACPLGKTVTPQEVLDAVADALLNEGALAPLSSRDPKHLDS